MKRIELGEFGLPLKPNKDMWLKIGEGMEALGHVGNELRIKLHSHTLTNGIEIPFWRGTNDTPYIFTTRNTYNEVKAYHDVLYNAAGADVAALDSIISSADDLMIHWNYSKGLVFPINDEIAYARSNHGVPLTNLTAFLMARKYVDGTIKWAVGGKVSGPFIVDFKLDKLWYAYDFDYCERIKPLDYADYCLKRAPLKCLEDLEGKIQYHPSREHPLFSKLLSEVACG